MANHIYSTLAADVHFGVYGYDHQKNPLLQKTITIKGGANVITKRFDTPLGKVTQVSDEDLEYLKTDEVFKTAEKNGFLLVRKSKVDPEVAAADMTARDNSAQAVQDDFKEFDKDDGSDKSFRVKNKAK